MDRFESLVVTSMLTPLGHPKDKTCRWGLNLNAIGGSGIGKSERVFSLGRALGLNVYPIYVGTKAPEHIGGFPVNTPNGFSLECAMPQVRQAIDDERAILYLDEINTAPAAVQAACLSFVNERTIGEYMLPPGVRFLLSMNPEDIAANGRSLEIPMANRVLHCAYEAPSLRQWGEYMRGMYDPELPRAVDGEMIVRDTWDQHYSTALELCYGFLESSGGVIKEKNAEGEEVERSKFNDQPQADDPRAAGPWPSLRTWNWAVRGVAAARCLDLDLTVQIGVVEGLVGKGLASEWANYVKKANLPRPIDVLTTGWTIPKQLDVVRAVLASCASFTTGEKDATAQARYGVACWTLLAKAIEMGYADVAVKPMMLLIDGGLDISHPYPAVAKACEDTCGPFLETHRAFTKYLVPRR